MMKMEFIMIDYIVIKFMCFYVSPRNIKKSYRCFCVPQIFKSSMSVWHGTDRSLITPILYTDMVGAIEFSLYTWSIPNFGCIWLCLNGSSDDWNVVNNVRMDILCNVFIGMYRQTSLLDCQSLIEDIGYVTRSFGLYLSTYVLPQKKASLDDVPYT